MATASAPAGSGIATASTAPSASSAVLPPAPELALIEDDVPGATEVAKREGKVLFVEVWAPWCHTCLSMKNFVLPDPAIAPLRARVVFAAVDSDRAVNATFMGRYAVDVWPTLYVLDPKDGTVLGMWQGAASVEELRRFVTEAADVRDAKLDPAGPLVAMIAAKRAHAASRFAKAAQLYRQAIDRGGVSWNRRSEALYGLLFSLAKQSKWAGCAQLGVQHVASIEGAAVPADFCSVLLGCAKRGSDAKLKQRALQAVVARLRAHTDEAPAAASVDDRADALSILSRALVAVGDKQGAREAIVKQVALLERAAQAAPSPKQAATFDYARMNAYLALGEGHKAVAMFRERMQQLPDAYEPAARLAQTLMTLGDHAQARAPMSEAVKRSYGPRKLSYLMRLARLVRRLGDDGAERATLERAVALYGELDERERSRPNNKSAVDSARKRLQQLGD